MSSKTYACTNGGIPKWKSNVPPTLLTRLDKNEPELTPRVQSLFESECSTLLNIIFKRNGTLKSYAMSSTGQYIYFGSLMRCCFFVEMMMKYKKRLLTRTVKYHVYPPVVQPTRLRTASEGHYAIVISSKICHPRAIVHIGGAYARYSMLLGLSSSCSFRNRRNI